jgi:hypothetical protein
MKQWKNWMFILDNLIASAVENNEEDIDLKLTIKQTIFLRSCIYDSAIKNSAETLDQD